MTIPFLPSLPSVILSYILNRLHNLMLQLIPDITIHTITLPLHRILNPIINRQQPKQKQ